MAEHSYPEIMLLGRNGAGTVAEDSPPTPRTVRRAAPSKESKTGKPAKKQVDPDERLRQVISILLYLCGAFLLLAIISYTPLDQANADIGARDMFGIFTNDPAVSAKADTTENWLGLLGATLANFLINATIGYGTIFLPFLLGLWGYTIYKGSGYDRVGRLTLFTLGLLMIASAILGTVQLVSWMPHPAHEWSGVIGAFIASIFSRFLGTAGSFLLLGTAIVITLIYATNSDLRKAIEFIKKNLLVARERLDHSRSMFAAKLGERSGAQEREGTPRGRGAGTEPAMATEDNEPAQMVRRMRRADLDDHADIPLPAQNRREQKDRSEDRSIPLPDPRVTRATHLPPSPTAPGNELNTVSTTETAASIAAKLEAPATPRVIDEVRIEHSSELPQQAPVPTGGRLTLNVQEGETAADMEIEDEGELLADLHDEQINYVPPSIDLLTPQNEQEEVDDEELKENGRILQEKLRTFNIQIENLTVTPGPVVTLYEFVPAAGIKISQIESLADDIALAMKARGIRIIAPIPGKGTVGVEIPNHRPTMVRIRSVINTAKFREANFRLPLALGKTTVGEVFCDDLSKMPHLLIAGATGSGKSVGINSILSSLLYKMHPRDLKFVIIDPKKIELAQYKALSEHFLARCPDIDEDIITNPQNAVIALKSLEMEMDRRYDILAKGRQRNIFDYNAKVEEGAYENAKDFHHVKLPYIVLILDELADLMITAAKEVEEPIARLAQLARAIGIHMIVATQRPSVDVITGMIKANFPARIAYQVASKVDSRTILDGNGAEQLLGNGDMLYLPGGQPKPLRLQNAFVSTEEVESLCEHIGNQQGYSQPYMLPSVMEKARKSGGGMDSSRDELFDEAAHLVVRHQQGSVSLLQRRLKVGYSRAARIVDELEMAGIVGPFDGSKARAVLLESEAELEAYL